MPDLITFALIITSIGGTIAFCIFMLWLGCRLHERDKKAAHDALEEIYEQFAKENQPAGTTVYAPPSYGIRVVK